MPRYHVSLSGPRLPMDDPTPVGRALLVVHGITDISVMHVDKLGDAGGTTVGGVVTAGSLAEALWLAHQIITSDVLSAIFQIVWEPGVAKVDALDSGGGFIAAEEATLVQMEEPEAPEP